MSNFFQFYLPLALLLPGKLQLIAALGLREGPT